MDNTVHMPNIGVKNKVRILFGSIEFVRASESARRIGVAIAGRNETSAQDAVVGETLIS